MTQTFKLQVVVSIAGAALLLAGLFADSLGLSASGDSTGPLLMMLVGGLILLVGLLGKKFPAFYRGLGLILLNTLVFILLIEIGFGVIAKVISTEDEPEVTGWRALPYYQEKPWGDVYWEEDTISRQLQYDPFVAWKSPAFQGTQITVNENQYRVTPGSDCQPDSYTVFVFGGSTIFGTGSPDWGTIPAYLQQGLSENSGRPVCVVNFGQLGYVAAQEEIELMRQLQAGNLPDLVIFYNGVNDVYSAYLYGTTYSVYGLESIAAKVNGTIPQESLWDKLVDELQENSYTYKVFKSFADTS
ncbi:MAG: SGNH/GDSL hydrolase family protein, partial [Anaerolineae bacterium]|nr:SGNH/GDSL hydrolase family protein [Anaerolineae bacterium]